MADLMHLPAKILWYNGGILLTTWYLLAWFYSLHFQTAIMLSLVACTVSKDGS